MTTIGNSNTRSQSNPDASAIEKALQRVYTLNWETITYLVIFVVTTLTRFWDLGSQVMSHDESLHTYYSYELYDKGNFDHTPLMHGPLLFHAVAFFYFLFGVSDFSARIYTALLGIAVVMFPLLFRRYLGKFGAIFASIGLLISPMLLYYSRYIRHDIPSIFFMLVIVYAFMQYMDGKKPRRPIWMAVLSAAMLLMLASKEVAFMYIAIFGSFLTFYWIMRIIQDISFYDSEEPGIVGGKKEASSDASYIENRHQIIGIVTTVIIAVLLGIVTVLLERVLIREIFGYDVSDASILGLFTVIEFVIFILGTAAAAAYLVLLLNTPKRIADSLENTPSPLWQLAIGHTAVAGAAILLGYMIGSLMGTMRQAYEYPPPTRLYEIGMIALIFVGLESIGPVRTYLSNKQAPGSGQMMVNAMAHPRSLMLVIIAGTVLGGVVALWSFNVLDVIKPDQIWIEEEICDVVPGTGVDLNTTPETSCTIERSVDYESLEHMLVWLLVPTFILLFLVLLIFALRIPRHGILPWQDLLAILLVAVIVFGVLLVMERRSLEGHDFATGQPVAADPDAAGGADGEEVDVRWIFIVWTLGGLATILVAITRLLTNWWDYLNHQPIFDVLIVMGTLTLPWLAAFPLFWMGHSLDAIPMRGEALRDAFLILLPFLMVSTAVGVAWNWKVWSIVGSVFAVLFVLFFTTFFTNGDGIISGIINSLGYWLEQQGVRRGSQPQYYYTMLQMPVYEFLPMVLSSIAAFVGLSWIFGFRSEMLAEKRERRLQLEAAQIKLFDEDDEYSSSDNQEIDAILSEQRTIPPDNAEDNTPFMARPYDHREEMIRRRKDHEYLGGVPFLQMVAYWGLIIIIGLTMAGEKMPWLTTHISVPLALIGGWYVGQVVEQLVKRKMSGIDWMLMLVAMPVFIIAIVRLILPILSAEQVPFQGNLQPEIQATGRWIAALTVILITGYFIWYFALKTGWSQVRRLGFMSLTIILVLITMRSAWMFNYVNYDLPTEFGVYAHSGPAVKTTMEVVDEFAARSPEGKDIRIVYDADSSWPLVWYLRDYPNKGYIPTDRDLDPAVLDGAKIVIAGVTKNSEISRILGDDYYRFDYIRLWWPMQAYFNLNYNSINKVFQESGGFPSSEEYRAEFFQQWRANDYDPRWIQDEFIEVSPAASLYREGMFDIWWDRDYDRYGQAECVEQTYNDCIRNTFNSTRFTTLTSCIDNPGLQICQDTEEWGEETKAKFAQQQQCQINPDLPGCEDISFDAEYGQIYNTLLTCSDNVDPAISGLNSTTSRCAERNSEENRRNYGLANWPVSSALYLYVDKEFAARIWDTGLEGRSVAERLIPDPENEVGVVRTVNGIASFGSDYLVSPRGVTVDDDGNVYVADASSQISQIIVFDAQGNFLRTIGNEGIVDPANREIVTPWGVEYNPTDGNIYVTDFWGQHRIVVYTPDGELVDSHGRLGRLDLGVSRDDPDALYGPRDIAFDREGNIYIADTGNHRIRVYDLEWNHLRDIGAEGTEESQLLEPVGIEVHPTTGELYVAETWNQRISVFRRDGIHLRSWVVNMWEGTQSTAGRPYLVISPDGSLVLVSDMDDQFENNGPRVAGYDLNGRAVISFNGPVLNPATGENTQVGEVSGLAFNPDGNLYVVDTAGQRVALFPFATLNVQGSIQPGIDPGYTGPDTGLPDLPTIPVTPEDVARVYLGSLAAADYSGLVNLYCDTATIPSEEAFNRQLAPPFAGANTSSVDIQVTLLNEGNTARIEWSGLITLRSGTSEEQQAAIELLLNPLLLEWQDDGWLICPAQSTGIFGG